MDQLIYADQIVETLMDALGSAEHGLSGLPETLTLIIDRGLWKERKVKRMADKVVRFERFEDFVTTAPLEGLGADMKTLHNLCREDPKARDALDRMEKRPKGGKRIKGNNVPVERPEGNASAKALRRLRKDRPDLHAEVLAGGISPHGAMVKAGFRPRTVIIYPDDIDRTLEILRRHFPDVTWEAR